MSETIQNPQNPQVLLSERPHIGIFGDTNAGKSAIFNRILGQEMAIVSDIRGTTTDPLIKAMELAPYGAVALIDTAGLGDITALASARENKTRQMLRRTTLALYVADVARFNKSSYADMQNEFHRYDIPHILVFSKIDTADPKDLDALRETYPKSAFVSIYDNYDNNHDNQSMDTLKSRIADELEALESESEASPDARERGLLGDILPKGSTVVLVIPIDSETPRGRLILPQVQLIRECLDFEIKCVIVPPALLEETIRQHAHVDLVVTDSQIFDAVADIVPRNVLLTSFSMLFARKKGDLATQLRGAGAIDTLNDGDSILIAEACSHTTTHEDIGTVKIPALLRKTTGREFRFEFMQGHDFPENIANYAMIIHCGACMITDAEMRSRIKLAAAHDIPITNYGMAIAKLTGILERVSEVFK